MWIYNITFFTHEQLADSLLADIRGIFRESAERDGLASMDRLARVAASPSAPADAAEAVSFSVQFRTAQPDLWSKDILPGALETIEGKYGENALHFDTLLELLEL